MVIAVIKNRGTRFGDNAMLLSLIRMATRLICLHGCKTNIQILCHPELRQRRRVSTIAREASCHDKASSVAYRLPQSDMLDILYKSGDSMEYRTLGKAGVKVSAIGIGCNQFGGKVDAETTKAIIHRALDEGINFFDTADVYSRGISEEYVGAALAGQWDKVVIATKVRCQMCEGPNDIGTSRYHILDGAEASLRRLGTDHIDLYQIHGWDESVPVEEMMRALHDLIRSGKVRYVGTSQFSAWQLCRS